MLINKNAFWFFRSIINCQIMSFRIMFNLHLSNRDLLIASKLNSWDFPSGAVAKYPPARRCKKCGFNPWVRKIPWRRAWQFTPVFLSGESHEQRSLAGYIQSVGSQRVRPNWATVQALWFQYYCYLVPFFLTLRPLWLLRTLIYP